MWLLNMFTSSHFTRYCLAITWIVIEEFAFCGYNEFLYFALGMWLLDLHYYELCKAFKLGPLNKILRFTVWLGSLCWICFHNCILFVWIKEYITSAEFMCAFDDKYPHFQLLKFFGYGVLMWNLTSTKAYSRGFGSSIKDGILDGLGALIYLIEVPGPVAGLIPRGRNRIASSVRTVIGMLEFDYDGYLNNYLNTLFPAPEHPGLNFDDLWDEEFDDFDEVSDTNSAELRVLQTQVEDLERRRDIQQDEKLALKMELEDLTGAVEEKSSTLKDLQQMMNMVLRKTGLDRETASLEG